MKKTLALVLALAMVFSTITVAFAEGTIGADAQICADLGMLKGSTGTVDAAYVATAPTRIQAAVMFLRLKGLEAEAMAFKGDANFADADTAAWAKPVMAYLKANPQLGWAGDGKNFNPTNTVTAKEYYKVLLETLGYKQNTAEVVGDFTWDNVVEFAAGKGLTKVAAVTSYTVNDLAIATVEALKLNVKDTTKTLVASLIEAGKVDAAKATAAGIYSANTTAAALDAVIASANDKVEVTFDADVDKAFAENAANYKIVAKGTTTALEVKSAKAVGTTMAELTTAAQTGGAAYTLTVGTKTVNFSGVAKESAAPEVDTVKCIDTNTIEVVFKKAMDRASVEDVVNYALNNGATVKAAELWIDQDDSRKTVKLTTEGLANNKVYKLTMTNVKSADLATLKSISKSFTGIADTKAPTISGNVIVKNNQRLWVKFSDTHGLDKATVENIANWSIDGLTITKITAKDDDGANFGVDDYGYLDLVEIDTEPMTASKKYTITMSNLIDGSTSKNAIAKALTKTFYGVAVDKAAPKVGSIKVYGDNIVEIPFTDANRLDSVTATDINNYTFTEGLQVLSAKILRPAYPDSDYGKLVVLTTSTMDTDTTYKISVANVADEFGNVMTTVTNRNIARTTGQDITPPAVKTVAWVDKNTVKVTFAEVVDMDSATDPTNYSLNNGLGTVKKAELSGASGYVRVTLTTPDMTTNKNYTVTINGVKDRVGNELSGYKAYFTAGQTAVDTDAPTLENIVAVNKNEVQLTFNETVKAASTSVLTLREVKSDGTLDATDINSTTIVGLDLPYYTTDDNTTVTFQVPAMNADKEYAVFKLTKVTDYHNNTFAAPTDDADKDTFYGSSDTQDDLEVIGVDQLDMKNLQVTFSRPVVFAGMVKGTDNNTSADSKVPGYNATIDIEDDETTDALSVLNLEKASGKLVPEKEITLDLSNIIDYSGTDLATADKSYKYTPYLDDTDKPIIEYVEAVNTNKVQIHFNEDIDTTAEGTYSISGPYTKGSSTVTTKQVPSAATALDANDDTIVNLNVSTLSLIPGEVYTLVPKTAAKDIAGNTVDIKDLSFEFPASSVVMKNYIKGVAVIDARTVEVRGTTTISAVVVKNDTLAIQEADGTIVYDGSVATVDLNQPLVEDVTYTVSATVGGDAVEYSFTGILANGGIEVETIATVDYVTFSEWNTTDYVVQFVYQTTSTPLTGVVGSGFDADDEIAAVPTGVDYMVEVYKKVDGVTEKAPIYTRVFTK